MGETVLGNALGPTGVKEGDVATGQTPPDPAPTGVEFPENWKEAIPEDIRDAEVFKLVPDVPTMAKNYYHAQKAIGSDKIPVPSKHATEEDWKNVYHKLGLPKELEEYKVDPGKDGVDEEFINEFKKTAHEANILPAQAQKMLDWYMGTSEKIVEGQQKAEHQKIESAVHELKQEFGDAYTHKVNVAKNALTEIGGEELAEKVITSDIANNPDFIRLMVKAADFFKDDPVKGAAVHGNIGMSPGEAEAEMTKLRSDVSFLDRNHPNHANSIAEMDRLARIAWPD